MKKKKKKRGVQRSHDRCKGEGSSQRSYDRWGGGGGGERRKGGPGKPTTLGSSALHSEPATLGPSGPFGPSLGPVRPAKYKAHGLAAGLKKIKFRFDPTH